MLQIVEEWDDNMYGVFDTETNEMRMCHKTQLIVMRENKEYL